MHSSLSEKLSAISLLKKAFKLVDKPKKWIQNAYQTNTNKFCMVGALQYVYAENLGFHPHARAVANRELTKACCKRGSGSIIGFNDRRTTKHKDVVAAFRKAIRTLSDKARKINKRLKAAAKKKKTKMSGLAR